MSEVRRGGRATSVRRSADPWQAPTWRDVKGRLTQDLVVAVRKDPSLGSESMALLHPGVHAVWLHRAAHRLHGDGHQIPARLLAYVARTVTGVDMHPGAVLGQSVFIDHGAGVVIGEDAVLEQDVMLYHNVTIGSVGWWSPRSLGGRRHPTIGQGAILCTGALVLGPITVGAGAVVGANAVVLADVPPGGRVPPASVWRGRGDLGSLPHPVTPTAAADRLSRETS